MTTKPLQKKGVYHFMKKLIALFLLIFAFSQETIAEEIHAPLAIVPQYLGEVGIVGDDWIGELTGSKSLELIDGEDLDSMTTVNRIKDSFVNINRQSDKSSIWWLKG